MRLRDRNQAEKASWGNIFEADHGAYECLLFTPTLHFMPALQ
jgi:hypothetical protein